MSKKYRILGEENKIVSCLRRDVDMKDARFLISVYECCEDARATHITNKEMWDRDYKVLYDNQDYSDNQLEMIIDVINHAVDMIKEIGDASNIIEGKIKELEKENNLNIYHRLQFLDSLGIPVELEGTINNIILHWDRDQAIKYYVFLLSLQS